LLIFFCYTGPGKGSSCQIRARPEKFEDDLDAVVQEVLPLVLAEKNRLQSVMMHVCHVQEG
jgi:hypothetical protein